MRKLNFICLNAIAIFGLACTSGIPNGSSKFSIQTPSRSVGTLATLPTDRKACYAINITDPAKKDIPETSDDPCSPPTGIVAGFVGPDESVSTVVPQGTRTISLYLYLLPPGDNSPCPTMNAKISPKQLRDTFQVGQQTVSLKLESETVEFLVDFKGESLNIAKQLGLPESCVPPLATPSPTPPPLSPAVLSFVGSQSYSFGSVLQGTAVDQTFTLVNQGQLTATGLNAIGITAPYSFVGGAFPGSGGTCGSTLSGNSSTCTLVVRYLPTTTGYTTSTLSILYNNSLSQQAAPLSISGTGTAAITLNTVSYGYLKPTEDTSTRHFPGIGPASDVAISGNTAYVGTSNHGVVIFDIASPSAPVARKEFYVGLMVRKLKVYGSYLYIMSNSGLKVVDISTPLTPVEVKSMTGLGSQSMSINGNMLYTVERGGTSAIHAVNISNPTNPNIVGNYTLATGSFPFDIFASGNYVYVANGWNSSQAFAVIDVSNPAAMSQTYMGAASISSAYITGIAVSGNLAYLSDANFGIHIVDVSTPSAPTLLSSTYNFDGKESNQNLIISGSTLYILNASGYAVSRIGVTSPTTPDNSLQAVLYGPAAGCWPCAGNGFALSSGNLYVAATGPAGGFYIAPAIPSRTAGSLTLTSVSPTTNVWSGTTLTFTGTGFSALTTAAICGIPCTTLTYNSTTSLTCIAPANSLASRCGVTLINADTGDPGYQTEAGLMFPAVEYISASQTVTTIQGQTFSYPGGIDTGSVITPALNESVNFNVTVTAVDQYFNRDYNYDGPVSLTATGASVSSAPTNFTAGIAVFTISYSAGTYTVQATASGTPGLIGSTSTSFNVPVSGP